MQTSYSYIRGRGYEGQMLHQGRSPISGYPTVAGVKDGRVVVVDSASSAHNAFKLPTSAAELAAALIMGISAYESSREPGARAVGDPTALLQDGECLLMTEGAVVKGTAAFVRHAAGAGGTELGMVRADGDSSTAAQVASIVFLEDTSGAALVRARISL